MARLLQWVRIFAFAVFIAAPVVVLLGWGAAQPYGAPFTPFPRLSEVLQPEPEGRAAVGRAVLDRSPVRRVAIAARSQLLYDGLGYAETETVLPGADGWLFYKPEFWGGRCYDESFFAPHLAFAGALTDVAEAAGIRLVLSVSPDKSTIYPEKLLPRTEAVWGCKPESSQAWRRVANLEAPRIVDHAPSLLAAKSADPGLLLYYPTDTHWTPYGAAIARRQLVAALSGRPEATLPPPTFRDAAFSRRRTDLLSLMLGIEREIAVPEPDAASEAQLASITRQIDLGSVVVVHDSFFDVVLRRYRELFPEATFVLIGQEIGSAIETADTLIFNSVERIFFDKLGSALLPGSGPGTALLAWNGEIGAAVLKRNQLAAQRCRFPNAEHSPVRLANLAPNEATWVATGPDPQLVTSVPTVASGAAPCLLVSIETSSPDTLEIFLPRRSASGPTFVAGRSIRIPLPPGEHVVRLALPSYLVGRSIRIDPGEWRPAAPTIVRRVAIGELARGD